MPIISGEPKGSGVQAVVMALHMLEHIAHSQRALGVTELARSFGSTKSRVYRHLQTLVAAGYLIQDKDTERYRISARLMALGQVVSDGHEISVAARPAMRELRDAFGHSVALSIVESGGVHIVATLAGKSNVEIGVKPGSSLSLHASAQGKVALAFGDEGLMRRLMQAPLEARTPRTVTDPVTLAAEIHAVRQRGWAAAPNEALIGLNAVAAPVLGALGQYAGAVAAVDSIQFIPEAPHSDLIKAVVAAARRISADLGYRPRAAQRA
jgi:IclR family transcriptional regulator, KDG regulon repressor